ncbi:hypothetical protein GIB67_010482 [Kingdonia uniflora]|uniref:RNase H type-1 domain-containing protein n=1 Tax=Kingdonia uniflora TaxID=39325 RepID=A0A7J7MAX9_9MAGN|nr:hypothetical protein GIB67_010482 [Kingdonia uniflora]
MGFYEMFYEMERMDVERNEITFLGVLSACNHGGLVKKVKGQAIANFLVDFPVDDPDWEKDVVDNKDEPPTVQSEEKSNWVTKNGWKLLTEGSVGPAGSGVGIVLITPSNDRLKKSIHLNFEVTNNVAEYEVLIHGLDLVLTLGVAELSVYTDSLLIVNHHAGIYQANGKRIDYAATVVERMNKFQTIFMEHLPRGENRHSDALAYLAGVLGSEARYLKINIISNHNINAIVSNTINTGGNEKIESD